MEKYRKYFTMKKRLLILLIAVIVIVNISTDCGYGRERRARRHKEYIDSAQVDSILMWKASLAGDTIKHPWKKLSTEKIGDFVNHWNWSDGSFEGKFIPVYYIEVYLKGRRIRKFKAAGGQVKEKRFYYSGSTFFGNYFEGLYGE
jgi:hypothetical protein